ncbi:patatin-like phospholipase family protein [Christiangramia forsetii]|uniref:Patatin-like phospholipase n=2 Tax=Christiangramia forsetii TaxID=411153 RepID=A0M671_CHRFK|nr:patatin-like phospholipase family protein [Christiangramia forsetii]GGG31228.1 patatin [Christiangramia forsetii]CAL68116.1 patatin-like phospholipase [Christiangramia forsetii KT0803]
MQKFLVLLFFTFTLAGFGQEKSEPKIGLVLSGGGAKGLAHIGVLKVLEEEGIKIDYIGGTSMGAIIGGLYASGYSANQLDSIFDRTNFDILIQDNLPRRAKTFYEKEDSEKYAITLPFDNFDISFPTGLFKGQNIYNLMSQLTIHVSDVNDFSKLPIPFFCVAANVETGEQVILDKGSLAKAISASGAIPTILSPLKIDDQLLTDGGVANNYPVEELRRRGADIVIGVDVQDSLVKRDKLKGVFEIMTQISNFRTINDMKDKIPLTDIYIKPDISPFSVMSFDEGNAIIDSGRVAALTKLIELKSLSEKSEDTHIRKQIKKIDAFNINALTLEGNNTYPRAYVQGKLKLDYDEPYNFEDLSIGLNNLSATGNFERINYRLLPEDDEGNYLLAMQIEESDNKMLLRLGLHYDELYKSGALVNLTRKSLLFSNDVASIDFIVGDNLRYNFNYYLDKGFYWSVGINSRYNTFDKNIDLNKIREVEETNELESIRELEVDFKDFTNQLYVETLFQQVFSIGAGLEHKYLKLSSRTFNDVSNTNNEFIFDNSHYGSVFGYLKFDSYDNKYFPTKGLSFNGDFHLYLYSSDFNNNFAEFSIAKGAIGYAVTPFNKFTTRISTETGFKIGNDGTEVLDFFLGGYGNDFINNIKPFYGYDFLSLSGDSYIKALLEVDYQIFRKNHISAGVNIANVEDRLYTSGNWISTPDFTGYALGYGIDTFMGPLEAKYTYSPEIKESYWFFSLGFWF